MTFENAIVVFDAMWPEHKAHVRGNFEHTWGSPAFVDYREAFVQAVTDETAAIEKQIWPTKIRNVFIWFVFSPLVWLALIVAIYHML